MATTVINPSRQFRGLRPLDPRRDLPQVADLIEHAFSGELDSSGQAALRELRLMGRLGRVMGLVSALEGGWPGMFGGYVWVEDGHVVGNVTVQRADAHARRWQIANVAVAPEYRGRGIGRMLMEAALDHIRAHKGTWAVLQVRADNVVARRLYEQLGFEAITESSEMRRDRPPESPLPVSAPLPMETLSAAEWEEVYDLALASLPTLARWWQPPRRHRFQITADQRLGEWLKRLIGSERVWRLGIRIGERLATAVMVRAVRWQPLHRLEMWVHPDHWGKWELSLVAQALNLLIGSPAHEIAIHVNTEYTLLVEALRTVGFRAHRTLVTMRRRICQEVEVA
jgi:ribosomal protein S18 acetylase RimI-like enzyme